MILSSEEDDELELDELELLDGALLEELEALEELCALEDELLEVVVEDELELDAIDELVLFPQATIPNKSNVRENTFKLFFII